MSAQAQAFKLAAGYAILRCHSFDSAAFAFQFNAIAIRLCVMPPKNHRNGAYYGHLAILSIKIYKTKFE